MFWPQPHNRVRCSYLLFASSLAFTWSANATPPANLALATADRYIGVGEKLVVAVRLDGDAVQGVGAQIVLNYDATKLAFESSSTPGALDLPIYERDSAGVYKLALGTSSGNSDVSVGGAIALLTFNVTGEFVDASGLVSFGGSGRVVSKISNALALLPSDPAIRDIQASSIRRAFHTLRSAFCESN